MSTVTMRAPAAYQNFVAQSGNAYASDSAAMISGVTQEDVLSLFASGCWVPEQMGTIRVPLLSAKNSDGSVLAAAASAGKFGVTITLGTAEYLVTEAANSNTKTDIALFELVLPNTYAAGDDLTLTVNTEYVLGSGTVGTHTLDAEAFLGDDDGTSGADLIAVAAQTVPATATELEWTIPGDTLQPGARVVLRLTLVIQDTGGSNITARINSIRYANAA